MKIKFLLTIPVFVLAFFSMVFVAGTTNALDGVEGGIAYFWGGTNDGVTPSAYQGAGAFDATQVVVPATDGDVTGYAWSGHGYGWVSFEDVDVVGCPVSGTCYSKRVGNALQGWARVLSIKNDEIAGNSGGWSGWIQLDGVAIDPITKELQGYAWSNELGYIQFSGKPAPAPTLTLKFDDCLGTPVPMTMSLTLSANTSLPIVACDGFTDVTATTTWSDESGKNFAEFIDDNSRKKIKALTVGMETVTAQKGANIYSVDVSVSDPCILNGCESSTCIGSTCDNGCDSTAAGTKVCNPTGFKEVAP